MYKINEKYIKLELWDTNVKILNSQVIESKHILILAYYKICNGFIMVCDISIFDSIKFLEKQIEKIIKISSSYNNIHLYVNMKEDSKVEEFYHNLNYINTFAEKYFIKPNFVNLSEYDNKKDKLFESFITNSLIKKNITNIKLNNQKQTTPKEVDEDSLNQKNNSDCNIF